MWKFEAGDELVIYENTVVMKVELFQWGKNVHTPDLSSASILTSWKKTFWTGIAHYIFSADVFMWQLKYFTSPWIRCNNERSFISEVMMWIIIIEMLLITSCDKQCHC